MSEEHISESKVKEMIDGAIKEHASTAYPDGDVHGHKRAHDLLMKDLRAKQKMREELLTKIITNVAWAIVVGVGFAVWAAIKSEIH